ncbi:MAG TPA: hypothetical protein VF365_02225 [Candidatus Limnocylindria bacterium]
MQPPRRLSATAILALGLTVLAAGPAGADCQPAGPVDEALAVAPVAFVGVVTATAGPVATIAVRDIWAGDVDDVVEVRGLSDEGGADAAFGGGFSEDDRQWTAGATYLVVPWIDGETLRDSICTGTTEWRPELEALRPAMARSVADEPAGGESIPPALLLTGLVVVLAAAASALAFRRR